MPPKVEEQKAPANHAVMSDQVTFLIYHYFWAIDVLLVLIIVAIGYFFLLVPKYSDIYSGAAIVQEQNKYDTKLKYLEELRTVRKLFSEIKAEDKAKISQIMNYNNDPVELSNEYGYIVKLNNGKAVTNPQTADANFKIDPLSDTKRFGTFGRKITRTTVNISDISYSNLQKIIRTMETNLRLMDINKIEYNPQRSIALLEVLTYQAQ
ncbi:MAG: hypothetical protein WCO55_03090 [Candidatus Falkowbacteria bacterium]